MDEQTEMVMIEVMNELEMTTARYGEFRSAHEAYAVILEEVDEFWDEVKKKRSDRNPYSMRLELIQVAAMACKGGLYTKVTPHYHE